MRKGMGLFAAVAAGVVAIGMPAAAHANHESAQPCVAGPFMVFFDFEKAELSSQARAILDNAASAYQTCGSAQVMIAGHTDSANSAEYNISLSQREAMNVRDYLLSRGIPDGVMTTEAFGESRPLVETGDGVREPQNRRVEITFGPGSGW